MSFDLYFKPKDRAFGSNEFNAYFKGRQHYEWQMNDVTYANESTGVYFHFSYAAPSKELPEGEIAFNMNLIRPSPFALEAEPEVTAFVEHFHFAIDDPQVDGMGSGPYTKEGFISSWSNSNKFGYSSVQQTFQTLPSQTLEQIWRWNFESTKLQKQLGEGIFVPRFFTGVLEGRVKTFVVWGDGIPIALPKADLLLLVRERTSPKKILLIPQQTLAIVRYSEAEKLLEKFPESQASLPYKNLNYKNDNKDVDEFFTHSESICDTSKLVQITFDQILDTELWEKTRKH
ncbi:MAG: hypothetical protein C0507_04600 [Cyanobacteria bacterium PR.3.49]|nr:hypothetical protein [Cyanobacteria bacterium PR.3.49]